MSSNYFRDVHLVDAPSSPLQYTLGARNMQFPNSFDDPQRTDSFMAHTSFGSRLTTSTTTSMQTYASSSSQRKAEDPLASACIGIIDLIAKTFITHPCTVLRRQCQVHQSAKSLHLTPFTLIPVVCKLVNSEGCFTLLKGGVGTGVLWGLSSVGEILIADIFGLPRHYVKHGSVEKFCRHLILKASTAVAMTPFIVSAFIKTVRSESGLGDDYRVMDIITSGINRLRFDFIGPKDNSKRFTLLYLSIPTACLATSKYLITVSIVDWIHAFVKRYFNRKPFHERTLFDQYFPQIFASLTSQMLADLVLYPCETVVGRLYIQGTRTLIDNLDNGTTAISIAVKYSGFFDCFKTIIYRESVWSLYAGVGALGLQYILHLCLLRIIRTLFEYGSRVISVHQQQTSLGSSASAHRMEPNQFDSSSQLSSTTVDDNPIAVAGRFASYPTFGQTTHAFGRTSPPLLNTSTGAIFTDQLSSLCSD